MSQVSLLAGISKYPDFVQMEGAAGSQVTLNATGETLYVSGHIMLQDPSGGSKTISAAGGGSIVWKAVGVTFANAGTTFKVGIQDVSTVSSPAQGDGTFDVEASFTGGGGGVTGSATQTSVMTSGTKTIAHGDLVSITFSMTARGGADSVAIQNRGISSYPSAPNLPALSNNTSGSYSKGNILPNCYIVFDDGTLGWFLGQPFYETQPTIVTFNSTTGTADEYGNIINSPGTFKALGMYGLITAGTSSDFELILYSDPLGTPVAERTVTVDATQLGNASSNIVEVLFTSPFTIKANTAYAVSIRPTTANNVSIYYIDGKNSLDSLVSSQFYSCSRLDNTGAFSDYNGGTAKTRVVIMGLMGAYMEQGVNMCSGQVGVY